MGQKEHSGSERGVQRVRKRTAVGQKDKCSGSEEGSGSERGG